MARKIALVFVLLLLLLAFPRSASVTTQHFQGPPDFQRDVSAGRPGSFRFITNEQLRADRMEIADLRAGIERLHRLLPTVKDATAQREINTELERWSLHIARGTNVVQLSRLLGHHSAAFTLTTYVHLIDGDVGQPLSLSAELRTNPAAKAVPRSAPASERALDSRPHGERQISARAR